MSAQSFGIDDRWAYGAGVDPRQLRAFVAVARELSFRRAAEALYLAPATVSEAVAALERDVGGPLLQRTSRRVVLTEAGERLYPEAVELLARLDSVREATRRHVASTAGTLRVVEPAAVADAVCSAIAAAIETATSKVVQPVELTTAEGIAALRDRRVDLAIALTPVEPEMDGDLTVVVACREPVGLLVPAGHRLSTADVVERDDLDGEEVFLLPRTSAAEYVDYLTAGLQLHHPGAIPRDRLATVAVARAAARHHLVLATRVRLDRLAEQGARWLPLAEGALQKTTAIAARASDRRATISAALQAAGALAPKHPPVQPQAERRSQGSTSSTC